MRRFSSRVNRSIVLQLLRAQVASGKRPRLTGQESEDFETSRCSVRGLAYAMLFSGMLFTDRDTRTSRRFLHNRDIIGGEVYKRYSQRQSVKRDNHGVLRVLAALHLSGMFSTNHHTLDDISLDLPRCWYRPKLHGCRCAAAMGVLLLQVAGRSRGEEPRRHGEGRSDECQAAVDCIHARQHLEPSFVWHALVQSRKLVSKHCSCTR